MATVTANLQNLATQWGVPDSPTIIADLVKRSGMLQTALVLPSSHGNKHRYKFYNSLPTAALRAIGTGIVPSKVSDDMAALDLWEVSALAQVDAQEIRQYPGGKDGWLRAYMPGYLASIGQAAAKQAFYGTDSTFGSTTGFMGLHQYAKANSKVVAQKSGSTGSRTSIWAVRWDGDDGASIRTGGNSNSNLFSIEELNPQSPSLAVTSTTTMAQLPTYNWWMNAYMTLVIPAATACACITQVDSTHAPTADDMNALLDAVDTGTGTTYIYCNNLGSRMIASLKTGKLSLFSETMSYNDYVAAWRGVPIIIDQNIVSTESTVLD